MPLRHRRDLTMAEVARGPGNARVDHVLVAEMIPQMPACSMSAAAMANF